MKNETVELEAEKKPEAVVDKNAKKVKILTIALIAAMIALGVVGFMWAKQDGEKNDDDKMSQKTSKSTEVMAVNSFADCIKRLDAKMLETSPQQCVVDGKTFKDAAKAQPVKDPKTAEQGTAGSSGIGHDTGAMNLNEAISTMDPSAACKNKFASTGDTFDSSSPTIFYGDFNSDNVQDAVVGLTISGTGKYGKVCAYTVKSGVLSLMWVIPEADVLSFGKPTSYQAKAFKYSGAASYDGAGTVVDTTYIYTWNGTTFSK